MSRLSLAARRLLPAGWGDLLLQLVLFGGAYYAYRIVRGVVDGQTTTAFENARLIVDWERSLGLFFEPGLQDWVELHAPWLVTFSNWMYVNSHFTVTVGFLIWLYLFRHHAFYFVRNMFMVSMALALVGYLVMPTAPPRFMSEWGFSDSVAGFLGPSASEGAGLLYNPFAAVPSMHVAFALMIALPAVMLVRNRLARALWVAYPVVVCVVVVVTANHWWLDVVLGAAVAGASAWAAKAAFGRVRPESWAWRRAPAKATA